MTLDGDDNEGSNNVRKAVIQSPSDGNLKLRRWTDTNNDDEVL